MWPACAASEPSLWPFAALSCWGHVWVERLAVGSLPLAGPRAVRQRMQPNQQLLSGSMMLQGAPAVYSLAGAGRQAGPGCWPLWKDRCMGCCG